MIAIVGHMSGGKSYTAVQYMLDYLLSGHVVCSNIRLKCQGVSSFLNSPCVFWKRNYYYITDDPSEWRLYNFLKLQDLDSYPCGSPRGVNTYESDKVYIFFDEASSLWDSLTSGRDDSINRVAAWCRQSEKRGQSIYFICQFLSELHKRLRNHVQEVHLVKNSAHVRLPLIRSRLPPFLRHFIIRTVINPNTEEILDSSVWLSIDKRIYSCYNTGAIVVGDKNFKSVRASQLKHFKRGNSWVQITVLGLILAIQFLSLLVVCLY